MNSNVTMWYAVCLLLVSYTTVCFTSLAPNSFQSWLFILKHPLQHDAKCTFKVLMTNKISETKIIVWAKITLLILASHCKIMAWSSAASVPQKLWNENLVRLKNKPQAHICLITFSVIFTHKGQHAFIFSSTCAIKVYLVSSELRPTW